MGPFLVAGVEPAERARQRCPPSLVLPCALHAELPLAANAAMLTIATVSWVCSHGALVTGWLISCLLPARSCTSRTTPALTGRPRGITWQPAISTPRTAGFSRSPMVSGALAGPGQGRARDSGCAGCFLSPQPWVTDGVESCPIALHPILVQPPSFLSALPCQWDLRVARGRSWQDSKLLSREGRHVPDKAVSAWLQHSAAVTALPSGHESSLYAALARLCRPRASSSRLGPAGGRGAGLCADCRWRRLNPGPC